MKVNTLECPAKSLTLDLMPDHTVRLVIECADAMAAGIVYEDIAEQAKTGQLRMSFTIGKITEE